MWSLPPFKKKSVSLTGEERTQAHRAAWRGQIRPQAVSCPAPPSFPRLPLSHQLCSLTPSLCPPRDPHEMLETSHHTSPGCCWLSRPEPYPRSCLWSRDQGWRSRGQHWADHSPLKLQFRVSKSPGCDVLGVSCQHRWGGPHPLRASLLSEQGECAGPGRVQGPAALSALQMHRCPPPSPSAHPASGPKPVNGVFVVPPRGPSRQPGTACLPLGRPQREEAIPGQDPDSSAFQGRGPHPQHRRARAKEGRTEGPPSPHLQERLCRSGLRALMLPVGKQRPGLGRTGRLGVSF